jgi:hypothetical protein
VSQRIGDAQLAFRIGAREHDLRVTGEQAVKFGIWQRFQRFTIDDPVGANAHLPGDFRGGAAVITGDDMHRDARVVAPPHRLGHLAAGRIKQTDHPE